MIRQEISGEKKYGIDTTGADELFKLEKQGIDISHATIYMPVSYALLEEIFEQLNLHEHSTTNNKLSKAKSQKISGQQTTSYKPTSHFLDIGCGKGRALCVAAHHGINKLTGLDFAKALCETAKQNLAITKQQFPHIAYNIINNDAFYFDIPADVDYIFLFNPFDEIIMSAVVKNICKSQQKNPRKITVVYVNPLHKELFLKAGFRETWYTKKMKYLEASILLSGR